MHRLIAALVATMAIAVGGVSRGAEDLLALTNADRMTHGLPALTSQPDLQAFAQRRAAEMARAGRLSHSQNLGAQLTNWRLLGENVGQGPTLTDIQAGFMGSAVHRRNILLAEMSEVGVGVVWDNIDRFYVVVIFRQPLAAAPPAPTSAPSVTSTPPTTARRNPALTSPPTTPPPPTTTMPPPPPPPPAPAEHPAPVVREAGPRLVWLLEATAGPSPAQPPPGSSPPPALDITARELLATADTGPAVDDDSAPPLLVAAAFLGLASVWMCVLGQARRRVVITIRVPRRF